MLLQSYPNFAGESDLSENQPNKYFSSILNKTRMNLAARKETLFRPLLNEWEATMTLGWYFFTQNQKKNKDSFECGTILVSKKKHLIKKNCLGLSF